MISFVPAEFHRRAPIVGARAGGLAIPARRTYPRDVATAAESVKQTGKAQASD